MYLEPRKNFVTYIKGERKREMGGVVPREARELGKVWIAMVTATSNIRVWGPAKLKAEVTWVSSESTLFQPRMLLCPFRIRISGVCPLQYSINRRCNRSCSRSSQADCWSKHGRASLLAHRHWSWQPHLSPPLKIRPYLTWIPSSLQSSFSRDCAPLLNPSAQVVYRILL